MTHNIIATQDGTQPYSLHTL